MSAGGNIEISIKDSGTGIKDLNSAFTLGSQSAGEAPLNEHGFGLKHALSSTNPENDAWSIFTRTQEDYNKGVIKEICAPYEIIDFSGFYLKSESWPGHYNGTGTYVTFTCSREMFKTLGQGIREGATSFQTLANILCEVIGFVYAGIISGLGVSITLSVQEFGRNGIMYPIGEVGPNRSDLIGPGKGTECRNLGGGDVTINYAFG